MMLSVVISVIKTRALTSLVQSTCCQSSAFICYSCNYNGAEKDTSCVNNPSSVTTSSPTVSCPYKYCSIVRTTYKENGRIFTFHRGCDKDGSAAVVTDSQFKTYTRKCTKSLCNSGDGLSNSGDGSSSGDGNTSGGGSGGSSSGSNDWSDDTIIVVQGIGSKGTLFVPRLGAVAGALLVGWAVAQCRG
uniref:Uncharacterized protein n=1 Tax=Timema monikensis TaxID=170555 RepID=A0A7R9EDP6_9NEOP|nr:unnamed protein product [Timema monikensis]